MFRQTLASLALAAFAAALPAQQAERIDEAMNAKIRTEGMEQSKVMWITHMLTDVYGPRPIGSPNHVAAANWAIKTLTGYGMQNGHLEPFTWGGIGWLPGRATGFIVSPVKANLKFEAVPWSPSTKGTVRGEVVSVVAPVSPTEAELTAYLTSMAPKVKGGIVMVGPPPAAPVNFNPPAKRIPDDQIRAQFAPVDPNAPAGGRGAGPGGFPGGGRGNVPATPEGRLTPQQVNLRITALIRDNLPALRLLPQTGGRIPGAIVAQNGAGQLYENVSPQPPAVILRNDDYGRIFRIIGEGTPVTVEFNVANEYYPEGKTSYVTVAEIPGTDKADEVVILGGHLDSWTSATGATDNAIGCAIMMEAVRILQAVGAKPRRTIRVALWSGEEEGELGSLDYVKRHFGSAEAPTANFNKVSAYWNIDEGTGLVRGASIFGPPAAAAILAQYFKPFESWGIYGAVASAARVEGGSDNGAFDVNGLPGIGTLQDPVEYFNTTWHTNLDTYERLVPDDAMKNAVITASVVYHLAMRDEILPRFAPNAMPAVPGGRGNLPANATPTAAPHVYVATKGAAFTSVAAALVGTVRAGDTAPTAAIGAAPANGKVTIKADGGFVYTPKAGFTGTDSFTYKLTRAGTTSADATVTMVVR